MNKHKSRSLGTSRVGMKNLLVVITGIIAFGCALIASDASTLTNLSSLTSISGSSTSTFNEHELQHYMLQRRRSLLNESTVHVTAAYTFLEENFHDDMVELKSWVEVSKNETELNEYLGLYRDPTPGLLVKDVCESLKPFEATGGVKPHVLIAHINEVRSVVAAAY